MTALFIVTLIVTLIVTCMAATLIAASVFLRRWKAREQLLVGVLRRMYDREHIFHPMYGGAVKKIAKHMGIKLDG